MNKTILLFFPTFHMWPTASQTKARPHLISKFPQTPINTRADITSLSEFLSLIVIYRSASASWTHFFPPDACKIVQSKTPLIALHQPWLKVPYMKSIDLRATHMSANQRLWDGAGGFGSETQSRRCRLVASSSEFNEPVRLRGRRVTYSHKCAIRETNVMNREMATSNDLPHSENIYGLIGIGCMLKKLNQLM